MRKRILFLCTGNSARSLMAEALLRYHGGEQFEVFSAGTKPRGVDPGTVEALESLGIDAADLHSKPVDQFRNEHFDFVISLCGKAARECRNWPGSGVRVEWDFSDPAGSGDPLAFKRTAREINERIKLFVQVNARKTSRHSEPVTALAFFKCLADETRLLSLLLIEGEGELCVCELVEALAVSQPKISRHLALLKNAGLLLDWRQGQWVYYRLNPDLEEWQLKVLTQTRENNRQLLAAPLERLAAMASRPGAREAACSS